MSRLVINPRHVWLGLVVSLVLPVAAMSQDTSAADPCVHGRELFDAQRFLEARDELKRCLDINGESVEALLPLVVMAVTDSRFETAIEFGERAVVVGPEDPDTYYWYGRALLRAGDADAAKAQWETGLQISLEHEGLLEGLARLALVNGEQAKAYNLLTQLQRLGVDDSWLHRLLGDIAASKGLWDQALGHVDQVVAKDGVSLQDLLLASQLALYAGQNERSVGYCRQAVAIEPSAAALGGLGEAFFAAEQVDSALVYLQKAVAADPENPHYHFNLANTYEISKQFASAETHFQEFLRLAPDDAMGHFNYGVHLENMGRTDDALFHVRECIRLDPGLLSAHVVLAQMLENQGRWDDALAIVESLQTADPQSSTELTAWADRLKRTADSTNTALQEGRIHLLYMVLSDSDLVSKVEEALQAGRDFSGLVVQYSSGPAAAKGGDIGWVAPEDLVEPLKSVVANLDKNEISPPTESGGLYHLFKRVH